MTTFMIILLTISFLFTFIMLGVERKSMRELTQLKKKMKGE